MNFSWYFGATGNLFDLQDRESEGDHEVLDTGGGGVPAKGTLTVKSVHRSLEGPVWVRSDIKAIEEQKKMLQ